MNRNSDSHCKSVSNLPAYMYCGIDSSPFEQIPSVQTLLSASEMLSTTMPKISGSLLHFAAAIVQSSLNTFDDEIVRNAYPSLKAIADQAPQASFDDIESIADTLLISADKTSFPNEIKRLAYLLYCTTTLYKAPTPKIMRKIETSQNMLNAASMPQPSVSSSLDFKAPGPCQFYPKSTPPAQKPTGPPSFGSSPSVPSGPPPMGGSSSNFGIDPETQKIIDLISLARDSFSGGDKTVAYTAMLAAFKSLE